MNPSSSAPAEVGVQSRLSDSALDASPTAARERRRLGERTPVVLDATVFRGAELRLTRTVDLSSSGCALRASPDPLVGRVTLQLVSNSGELLRVQARFTRSFQGTDAYEFVELDDTDRLTIAEIIDIFRGPEH